MDAREGGRGLSCPGGASQAVYCLGWCSKEIRPVREPYEWLRGDITSRDPQKRIRQMSRIFGSAGTASTHSEPRVSKRAESRASHLSEPNNCNDYRRDMRESCNAECNAPPIGLRHPNHQSPITDY